MSICWLCLLLQAESNKVRLCQRIVSQECLDRASPDYCVNRAIDDMQAEAAATATARTQSNTTAGSAAGSHEAANPATAVIAAFLGGAGKQQALPVQHSHHTSRTMDASKV